MKKYLIAFIVAVLVIVGGIWWWNSVNKTENRQQANQNIVNYEAERSGANQNIANTNTNTNNTNTNKITTTKKETEVANFSTKIYNKDADRQKNITITCNTLSSKEIQPGETFSFNDIVGKSTHEKGYEEADIYVDGKKEQGLGGGNCQVSTTLYNAVLQVPELEVVERHKHSGHVPYIQEGKDAAIAYGNYDFKFKNNTNDVIRIVMENTAENITAKLIKIEK